MLILSWLPKRPICPLRQSGTILGHLVGADSAQPFFSSQRLSRNSEAVHAEPLHSSEQTARNSFFLRSGVRATPSFAEAVHAQPLHSSLQTARGPFFLRSGMLATFSFAEAVHAEPLHSSEQTARNSCVGWGEGHEFSRGGRSSLPREGWKVRTKMEKQGHGWDGGAKS